MKTILFFIALICIVNLSKGTNQYCQSVNLNQLTTCSMISGSVFLPPEFTSIYDLDSYIYSYISELKSLGYVGGSTCENAIELFLCSAAFLQCQVLVTNCTSNQCLSSYKNCTMFNNSTNLINNSTINLNNTCYDNTIIVNGNVLQLIPPCRNPCLYARASCPSVDPLFLEEFDCEATVVEQGPFGQRIELPLFPLEDSTYFCINYNAFIPASSSSSSNESVENSSEKSYYAFTAIITVLVAYLLAHLFAR